MKTVCFCDYSKAQHAGTDIRDAPRFIDSAFWKGIVCLSLTLYTHARVWCILQAWN
jgi:hypothetical protein